ncbi:MAG TPA: 50S ribosomal protein L4 [Candidatus Moranbacteria bacterium]|nr:50S ribosomal protein L4 [Candidatus Moranbacteria bacterium]
MPKVAVHNLTGKKMGDISLSESVFGLPSNNSLLHQVYVALSAGKRKVIAHTKGRSDRKGSGKKPWKQKGTGRARTGSVKNPIWRKGGVTFGPTKNRNFKRDINKKMRQKGIMIALSEKTRSKDLMIVDEIKLSQKKTKDFSKSLEKLKIDKNVLIGFSDKEKDWRMFSKNIDKANNILTSNLNVFDILNNKYLLLSKDSVKYLEDKYKNK